MLPVIRVLWENFAYMIAVLAVIVSAYVLSIDKRTAYSIDPALSLRRSGSESLYRQRISASSAILSQLKNKVEGNIESGASKRYVVKMEDVRELQDALSALESLLMEMRGSGMTASRRSQVDAALKSCRDLIGGNAKLRSLMSDPRHSAKKISGQLVEIEAGLYKVLVHIDGLLTNKT